MLLLYQKTAIMAILRKYELRAVEAVRTWIRENQDSYWVPNLAPE